MARQARQKSKSGNYYVELKGSELFTGAKDKKRFMEILEEKLDGGEIYGVKLTKQSIHMAIKETENGISSDIKSVKIVYARYFNNANDRTGMLFEGRFKSIPLETKAELEKCVNDLGKYSTVSKKEVSKKAAAKPVSTKAAVFKSATKKKTEPKKEEKKEQPRVNRNLPSWLL